LRRSISPSMTVYPGGFEISGLKNGGKDRKKEQRGIGESSRWTTSWALIAK
jgi:hypothetical protein